MGGSKDKQDYHGDFHHVLVVSISYSQLKFSLPTQQDLQNSPRKTKTTNVLVLIHVLRAQQDIGTQGAASRGA